MTTPRPQWRDEFLRDDAALEKHGEEMHCWQLNSNDPFERADAALAMLEVEQMWAIAEHVFRLRQPR